MRRRSVAEAGELLISRVRRMAGLSQNGARELIRLGKVSVDGATRVEWSLALAGGERVEIDTDRRRPSRRTGFSEDGIVFRDRHLLVVEKPCGIVTAPPTRTGEPTLLDLLNGLVGSGARGRDVVAVHRLDHGTSGLMVFAFRGPGLAAIERMIAVHGMDRRYLAIVDGLPREGLYESVVDVTRQRFGGSREEKLAKTWVRVVERRGPLCLVECRLETGRFHQIRIQLAGEGTPLLGDEEHCPAGHKWSWRCRRLALHSHHLEFVHPVEGTRLRFESSLPEELTRCLGLL